MNNTMTPEKELEIINSYATVPLKAEDVFIFTVTLCDNEVDRDNERFTLEALCKLRELFPGKTGISDHSMRSKDQRARVFRTYLEESGSKNSVDEPYTALKARAYMLRSRENESLIAEIEGGIKKEVSISCSMNKSTCSICKADMRSHACKHVKGRSYDGKPCFAELSEPTDAYEWSFVAVPAQRNAGVTKSFKKEEKLLNTPKEIFDTLTAEKGLSAEEICSVKEYVASLEALAADAKIYKSALTEEIGRLALIAMPKVNFKSFIAGCENMNVSQLRELRDGMEAQVREKMPAATQLKAVSTQNKSNDYDGFRI